MRNNEKCLFWYFLIISTSNESMLCQICQNFPVDLSNNICIFKNKKNSVHMCSPQKLKSFNYYIKLGMVGSLIEKTCHFHFYNSFLRKHSDFPVGSFSFINMYLFFSLLFSFFSLVSSQPAVNNNTWSWISGRNTVNASGVYGAKGIPSQYNYPGARQYAVGGIDSSGSFWLFGGQGYVLNGITGK